MIYENILKTIGNTPVIQLHRVSSHLACTMYGKCEFLNPGGSVKDRIAISMIEAAERDGFIRPGDTLIEPSSGNTGIGIAMAGAIKGYRVIITLPEKMSQEKQVILAALGATIIRTPTEAAWDAPESHIGVANRLLKEIPRSFMLDQYKNPANPDAHYSNTAQEIIDDFGMNLAMVVIGAGTGGTITGIAKRLKEFNPKIKIIGVDPYGSILAGEAEIHSYEVEGIGYDFIPEVLDNSLIDQYIKVNDKDSFEMAARLVKEEGLLIGGSSGSAVWAANKAAVDLKSDDNCLVILPDSSRNYLTKFIDEKWMQQRGYA